MCVFVCVGGGGLQLHMSVSRSPTDITIKCHWWAMVRCAAGQ